MGVSLISNPPYNMKHKLPELPAFMKRYTGWTLPPESNANFAFILSALELIDDRAVFLLPNGVLGSSVKQERMIREELIHENLLLAVMTLPSSMFESTSIPTCILIFDKNKQSRKIAMFDLRDKGEDEIRYQNGQFGEASHTNRTYQKVLKTLSSDLRNHCLDLLDSGKDEKGLCVWITPEQAAETDYNLSPSRYLELEQEPVKYRTFEDITKDYNRIIEQKNAIKIRMNKTAAKRLGYDCMDVESPDLTESFAVVGQKVLKENNITFSASDGIQITISTKDGIHPLVLDFLNHWKQMIMYLNNEENYYLAEFRDALLPVLMSGEISFEGYERKRLQSGEAEGND